MVGRTWLARLTSSREGELSCCLVISWIVFYAVGSLLVPALPGLCEALGVALSDADLAAIGGSRGVLAIATGPAMGMFVCRMVDNDERRGVAAAAAGCFVAGGLAFGWWDIVAALQGEFEGETHRGGGVKLHSILN